jgi:uncharacterized membrane protein YdjX (TVP38/TMEM64 family)
VGLLVAVVLLAGFVVASDRLHGELAGLVAWAERLIARAPVAGAAVFIVLTMLSAMLAFFSTGLLAPVAIAAWGTTGTLVLLWVGWLLGGVLTYAVGRYLGRSVAGVFVRRETLDHWEAFVRDRSHVTHLLLFQIAMPSEVLGYVLGLLRYRLRTYLGVLSITEIPYALAVVYLGESFLAGDAVRFVAIGLATVALSLGLYALLTRAARRHP